MQADELFNMVRQAAALNGVPLSELLRLGLPPSTPALPAAELAARTEEPNTDLKLSPRTEEPTADLELAANTEEAQQDLAETEEEEFDALQCFPSQEGMVKSGLSTSMCLQSSIV